MPMLYYTVLYYTALHFTVLCCIPIYSFYTKKSLKPLKVTYGMGVAEHDQEGRLIVAEYDKFYVLGCCECAAVCSHTSVHLCMYICSHISMIFIIMLVFAINVILNSDDIIPSAHVGTYFLFIPTTLDVPNAGEKVKRYIGVVVFVHSEYNTYALTGCSLIACGIVHT